MGSRVAEKPFNCHQGPYCCCPDPQLSSLVFPGGSVEELGGRVSGLGAEGALGSPGPKAEEGLREVS